MTQKALKICLACFAGFLILVFVFGPREPVRLSTGHDKIMIGDEIDTYLAMREGQFDDIIDLFFNPVNNVLKLPFAHGKIGVNIITNHDFVMAGTKPNRFTRAKNKNQSQKTGTTGKADFQGFFGQLPVLIVKRFAMAGQFFAPAMSVMRKADRSNHFSAIAPVILKKNF